MKQIDIVTAVTADDIFVSVITVTRVLSGTGLYKPVRIIFRPESLPS